MLPPYSRDESGARRDGAVTHLDLEGGGRRSLNASINGSDSLVEPLLKDADYSPVLDPLDDPPTGCSPQLRDSAQDSEAGLSYSPFSENDPIRWSLHEEQASNNWHWLFVLLSFPLLTLVIMLAVPCKLIKNMVLDVIDRRLPDFVIHATVMFMGDLWLRVPLLLFHLYTHNWTEVLHRSLKFGFPLVPTTLSWAAWPGSENERLLGLARFRMTDAVSRIVKVANKEDATDRAIRKASLRLLAATNPEQGVIMGRHCCDSDPRLDQLKAHADIADLNFPRGQTGTTVLMEACNAAEIQSVHFLLERGVRPNIQDLKGKSALHHAISAIVNPSGMHNPVNTYKVGVRKVMVMLESLASYAHEDQVDPCVVDSDGNTPYMSIPAGFKSVRARRLMWTHLALVLFLLGTLIWTGGIWYYVIDMEWDFYTGTNHTWSFWSKRIIAGLMTGALLVTLIFRWLVWAYIWWNVDRLHHEEEKELAELFQPQPTWADVQRVLGDGVPRGVSAGEAEDETKGETRGEASGEAGVHCGAPVDPQKMCTELFGLIEQGRMKSCDYSRGRRPRIRTTKRPKSKSDPLPPAFSAPASIESSACDSNRIRGASENPKSFGSQGDLLHYGLAEEAIGPNPKLLRLYDLLFAEHEGDAAELQQRRVLLFRSLLAPLIRLKLGGTKLSKQTNSMMKHIAHGLAGPPHERYRKVARNGYSEEMTELFEEMGECMKVEYKKSKAHLQQDVSNAPRLFNIAKSEMHRDYTRVGITNVDVHHGHFVKVPQFARTRDLKSAVHELNKCGAIRSSAQFIDVIQLGKHPLLPAEGRPLLFDDVKSNDFWMSMVTIWLLTTHHNLEHAFNSEMEALASGDDDDGFHRAPGIKGFDRLREKALEYIQEKGLESEEQQALAPTHVVDILRCSYTVDTISRNIELGGTIAKHFTALRAKNMHQLDNDGYADRKYNILFPAKVTEENKYQVVCEVQILFRRYLEIKKLDHLVYEFKRGSAV